MINKIYKMKKLSIITALLAMVLLCSFSNKQLCLLGKYTVSELNQLTAQGRNLKGNVKAVKVSHYTGMVVDGEVLVVNRTGTNFSDYEYDHEPETRLEFDRKGNLTYKACYETNVMNDLKLFEEYRYTWQNGYALKSEFMRILLDDRDVCTKNDYRYEGNRLKEEKIYSGQTIGNNVVWDTKQTRKNEYSTDQNGLVYGIVGFDHCGIAAYSTVNMIESGHVVRSVSDDVDYNSQFDKWNTIIEYKYQGDELVEEKEYFTIKNSDNTAFVSSDEIKKTYKDGLLVAYSKNYINVSSTDPKAELSIDYRDFEDDQNKTTIFLTYNENRDLIGIYEGSNHFELELKYDSHNNWIWRATYNNGKLVFVTTREIEYY